VSGFDAGSATSKEPFGGGKLTRVLPGGSKPGALLALPAALAPVGVGRVGKVVPPFALGLAGVDSSERLTARSVLPVGSDRFPVCRVLAGAVLAGVAAGAVLVPVVARMIHDLAGFERPAELTESETVGWHRAALAVSKLPVVLLAAVPRPRPAVIRAALIHVGGISLKPRHLPAERAAQDPVSPQLVVMALAKPLRPRGSAALAARSPHAQMAGLKRVPVLPPPLVVSDTQSPDVRRSLTVLTIRHSTIIARSAYEGVVPALCQALTRV